jgi:hypothetical protein
MTNDPGIVRESVVLRKQPKDEENGVVCDRDGGISVNAARDEKGPF